MGTLRQHGSKTIRPPPSSLESSGCPIYPPDVGPPPAATEGLNHQAQVDPAGARCRCRKVRSKSEDGAVKRCVSARQIEPTPKTRVLKYCYPHKPKGVRWAKECCVVARARTSSECVVQ